MKYILLFALMVLPFSVVAQDTKPVSIAVVDVQQLMNESNAAKSIQSQGKDLRAKYQRKIKSLENNLKKSEEKVLDAGKAKDQEKFIASRKVFQTDLIDSQREIQALNQKLDKAITVALNKLRDKVISIVDEMTVTNKYDLVITRADVMTVSRDLDITSDVMRKLNSTMSSIKVKD